MNLHVSLKVGYLLSITAICIIRRALLHAGSIYKQSPNFKIRCLYANGIACSGYCAEVLGVGGGVLLKTRCCEGSKIANKYGAQDPKVHNNGILVQCYTLWILSIILLLFEATFCRLDSACVIR
jgi:hypothetical protein